MGFPRECNSHGNGLHDIISSRDDIPKRPGCSKYSIAQKLPVCTTDVFHFGFTFCQRGGRGYKSLQSGNIRWTLIVNDTQPLLSLTREVDAPPHKTSPPPRPSGSRQRPPLLLFLFLLIRGGLPQGGQLTWAWCGLCVIPSESITRGHLGAS